MLRLTASLLLFTALLAGCSSSSAEGAEVAIHGNIYSPSSVTVKAGEHVHFANHDSVEHSVTPDSGGFSGQDVDGGQETDISFPSAGTFAYHCKYHASMHGTVTVS
ncbi:MAG TPA: cupredoxin domain-containing protein [Candidatus Thermoplasmatota archaeon]|nr:cupredoxin domain-containing protein [Candidatus Thermoplasmatota archaeon]